LLYRNSLAVAGFAYRFILHLVESAVDPAAGAADSHLMPIALLLPLLQSSPVYTMGSIGWPQPGTGCGVSRVWVMAAPNAMQPCLTMLSACSWLEMAAAN
jgi:hypothetical protein